MPSPPVQHRHHCLPQAGSPAPGPSSRLPQREKESRALLNLRLGPDMAAMTRDDPLYRGQTDSRTSKVGFVVQSLKWRKQLVGVRHIEPGAVVPEVEDGFVSIVLRPESNPGLGLFGCVLPGIFEQVLEENRDQVGISARRKSLCDLEDNLAGSVAGMKPGDHLARQFCQADWFLPQCQAVDA